MNRLIALDADGVLLDYHKAYARAWKRAFGVHPALQDSEAYWPWERWEVPLKDDAQRAQFDACFDHHFWSTVPPLPGAVQACHDLVSAGYDLVCVSALGKPYESARLSNLQELGFPIEQVFATGADSVHKSPKADVLQTLQPAAFVDDYLPFHFGVPDTVHKALIRREEKGSPNVGPELDCVHSQHKTLPEFVEWWTSTQG
jgi:phosphoglycolate phosphatase-like HAD superfamily hydrolase